MDTVYDVLIIGGGPAGLYASFYAGLRDMSVALFEAQSELGGKLNFYPEKMVWDVGALPPTKGYKVKEYLQKQATLFEPAIYTNTTIKEWQKEDNRFVLTDQNGCLYYGKTVLVAIGGGVISPQKLTCPIADGLAAAIHYEFPNQQAIDGKTLVISGGGDAAVDYAIEAQSYGAKVTLCYRGETLKAHEAQVKKLRELDIEVLTNQTILSVAAGDGSSTMALQLQANEAKTAVTVPCDHLLIQHGYDRDTSLLDQEVIALARHSEFYLHCASPTKTSAAGMFAAGDIHYFDGKVNLLVGAFQDATLAVNQIKQFIDPQSVAYGMVSSHNEKFHEKNQALMAHDQEKSE
ncbi:NAD(P)/FAD-dependent oxidoreductase [Enterococcus camelliae]|uniref:Ferredoxin--NADP reductase n=1 Tax=Enterococcus camelliae TaxID=453959 RepID=A0ABW5TK42_9ENTE